MAASDSRTTTERTSDTELVVTRFVKAPPGLVYQAWADPALFAQWWMPASFGLTIVSHTSDMRTGGSYRLVTNHPLLDAPMAFHGTYLDVVPGERIVRTNEESPVGAVSTVTFAAHDGGTLVVIRERFPAKAALDQEIASGATSAYPEQFAQLDTLLGQAAA